MKRLLLIGLIVLLLSVQPSALAYTTCDGVQDGDTVLIDYTGTISGGDRDGEVFDGPRENAQFLISASNLIQGFYEGILGIKIGEQRTIVVPPSKGYSEPHDLAGQTLEFDVFLEDIVSAISNCTETSSTESTLETIESVSNIREITPALNLSLPFTSTILGLLFIIAIMPITRKNLRQ